MSRGLKSRAGCEGGDEERDMQPEIQTKEAARQEVGGRQRAGKGPKAVRRNDVGCWQKMRTPTAWERCQGQGEYLNVRLQSSHF